VEVRNPLRVVEFRRALETLGRLSGEIIVALAALAAAAWAARLSGLLEPALAGLGVNARVLRAGLGLAALLAGLLGYSSAYPALAILSVVTAYVFGRPPTWLVEYATVGSILVAALVFHARRVYLAGGASAPRGGLRGLALTSIAIALAAAWIAGSAEIVYRLGVSAVSAITSGVGRMPYTLREFYTSILGTRLGEAVLAAVVAGVSARIYQTAAEPLVEALTSNPRAAASEVAMGVARELRIVLTAEDASGRVASLASTVLSLLAAPLIGVAVGLSRDSLAWLLESVGIGGIYAKALIVVVGLLVATSVWVILRSAARSLAPRPLTVLARKDSTFAASLVRQGSFGRAVARSILGPVNLLVIFTLILVAGLYVYNLGSSGNADPLAVLAELERAIQAILGGGLQGSDSLGAAVEGYLRGYTSYLAKYEGSLENLLRTLIKLLWGA